MGATIFYDNYGSKAKTSPFEFSRKETDAITWVTLFHLGKFWDSKKFKKVADMVSHEDFTLLCSVAYFDSSMRSKGDKFAGRMEYLMEIREKVSTIEDATPMPKGFGNRVSEVLNIAAGPALGDAIQRIREMVISGSAKSYEEALNRMR